MAIVGKYTNTTNEKVAEFFKALGATEEQLAAGAAKNEEKTLEVIDNGGDSYTIDIGPSKSSFKIGEPFENQIMGGKVTVKAVVKKPDANTLERSFTMPNGKSFTSTLVFTDAGCTNTIKMGDIVAKRVYTRN